MVTMTVWKTKKQGLMRCAIVCLTVCCACPAKPVPSPPQPPPPTVQANLVFRDEFSEYNPRWRQIGGQWIFRNDQLQQTTDNPAEGNAIMVVDTTTIADAEIVTAVRMTSSELPQYRARSDQETVDARRFVSGAGIVFRYVDDNNFYMFRLAGEEGAVFGKMLDGEWHDLVNPRASEFLPSGRIRYDEEYALRVKVEGNRIQCWVNNRAVVNKEDDSFSTGKFGLVTFRAQGQFSFIEVLEI